MKNFDNILVHIIIWSMDHKTKCDNILNSAKPLYVHKIHVCDSFDSRWLLMKIWCVKNMCFDRYKNVRNRVFVNSLSSKPV